MRHLLITGCTGAGKSTLATILAKHYHKPVIRLDAHPYWVEYRLTHLPDIEARQHPDSAHCRYYERTRREIVKSSIADAKEPGIIEGAQIMAMPELVKKHPAIVIMPTLETLVLRRVKRDIKRRWPLQPFTHEELAERIRFACMFHEMVQEESHRFAYAGGYAVRC